MDAESFVSEYPLPPAYFKHFATDSALNIQPPQCISDNLRNMCYGSSLQTQTSLYNENIDYKELLLRLDYVS